MEIIGMARDSKQVDFEQIRANNRAVLNSDDFNNTLYICPNCCSNVKFFNVVDRKPATLKCGNCGLRFDWRTAETKGPF